MGLTFEREDVIDVVQIWHGGSIKNVSKSKSNL